MKKSIVKYIKKMFLNLVCIMVILYIGFYLLLVVPAIKRVQRERNTGDIKRLVSLTFQNFNYLSANLKDNSQWNTLHKNLNGYLDNEKKKQFLEDLFTEETLKLFDLDYIAIYSTDKNKIVDYSLPGGSIEEVISSKGKKYFFSSQPNGKNRVLEASGYLNIEEKAYMFLSRVILKNDATGPPAGHLLFVKEIDDEYIYDLSIRNNFLLKLFIPGRNTREVEEKIIDLRRKADYYSEIDAEGRRVYYIPYMENAHKIAYAIKVVVDEKISHEIILSFLTGFLPILTLFPFVLLIKKGMDKKLVNPIMALYQHITLVKTNKRYKVVECSKVDNEMDEVIGAFNELMVQVRDQRSEIEKKNIQLKKLAYIDHLTGLSTRRVLDDRYELLFESAKRSGSPLTLVMMDIDYFKKYNDRYGHLEGDRVLKILGRLLKKVFKREGDIIVRYGGEEFLVILYHTPLERVLSMIKKFQKKLEASSIEHLDSPFGRITVSMGVRSGSISAFQKSQSFLREADEALYRAKDSGRNKYTL